ncbi:unknown [Bacteroides sp. CAG:754]|nr:unknown [Bacteroides sp. CAG:754]
MKIPCHVLQSITVERSQPQSQSESKNQSCHHIHQRGNGYGEVGENPLRLAHFFERDTRFDERRKYRDSGKIGEETRKQSGKIGNQGSDEQHLSRAFANVSDSHGDQSENNQRNGEIEELTENTVESDEYPYQRSRKKGTDGNT